MYRKPDLSRDDRGFVRSIGRTEDGKQARFRLGTDEHQARLAAARLALLWSRLEQQGRACWDRATLLLAKAVAKGATSITLACPDTDPDTYASLLSHLSNRFGDIIAIYPDNPDAYATGQRGNDELRRLVESALPPLKPIPLAKMPLGRLHEAMDDFRATLESRPDPSGHFHKSAGAVSRLQERHEDMDLADMNEEKMFSMLDYWAQRPAVKGTERPITKETAQYHIKRLREFWRWLHRSEKYRWKKPDGWEDLRVNIANRPEDRQRKAKALVVDCFTIAELTILYRSAPMLVKSWMLLALNCGFKRAEIASLTRDEVFLNQPHPEASMIGWHNSPSNWIRRLRGKTDVYAEWELWTETAAAVKYAMSRAEKIGEHHLLFVSENGCPYNAMTAGGNKSARIANLWADTLDKVGFEKSRRLSFKHLEKTAATMIRRDYGGEVAGLFESHGRACKTDSLADVYANRPYAKLFEALGDLRQKLSPMFVLEST